MAVARGDRGCKSGKRGIGIGIGIGIGNGIGIGIGVGLALALVACSGKARVVEDAHSAHLEVAHPAPAPKPPPPPPDTPAPPYHVDESGPHGDVTVTVEWHDVPIAARAPRGDTACATARLPAVAPTTTWGIPDVLVWVEADHGKPLAKTDVRVEVSRCTVAPRAIATGAGLAIASVADQPVELSLARAAGLGAFGAAFAAPPGGRHVMLPIAGHTARVALDPGIYELALPGEAADGSWIVAGAAYAAVTGPAGEVTLRDLPVGTYPIVAWLPPRGGVASRVGRGTVTIAAGKLVEVTLQLAAS